MQAPDNHPVETISALDALGCSTRREIMRVLGPGPRPVGEIAAQLPVSRPAVSKHLRILERAHLVAHVRSGTRSLFRVHTEGLERARRWLDAVATGIPT